MEEETQFDRQVFVKNRDRSRPKATPMGGLIFFLAVVGGLGFLGYKYVQANGLPQFGGSESEAVADLPQDPVLRKLEEIEQRLARLERGGAHKTRGTEKPKQVAAHNGSASSHSLPATQPKGEAAEKAKAKNNGGQPAPQINDEIDSLRNDFEASQEAWEAATDQLANTVGELGRQRKQLNRIVRNSNKNYLPFNLENKRVRKGIGPVRLWLKSTDSRKQRYTMRILVDDKWVELKDRVLHEAVEFRVAGYADPFELVVSEIRDNRVKGYVGVPPQG